MESRPTKPSEDQEKLLEAVRNGQVDVMEALLKNPEVNVDYVYPNLLTCLDEACRTTPPNCDKVVKFLLQKVKPKEIRPEPIHHAAESGNHLALREILRQKKCRVNAENSDGRTALHLTAKNFEKNTDNYGICLKLLLKCPTIAMNHPDMENCTPIMSGCREAVVKMLELRPTGFDLDSHLHRGYSDRQVILMKFPDLEEILPNVKVATRHTSAPQAMLLEGILNSHLEVFKCLLQQVDHDGTPVTDPNYFYEKPYLTTCIQEACSSGKPVEYLQALLRANADPNLMNVITGQSPIHVAIENKNVPAVQLLLNQATLNVNIRDSYGDTPLHYVVRTIEEEEDAERLVKQLLKKGADVYLENEQMYTAIMEATELKKKELLKIMLPKTDIEQEITNGVTLRSFIQTHLPEFVHIVNIETKKNNTRKRLKRKLFLMLYGENCEGFVKELENLNMTNTEMEMFLNEDDGKNTFLQTACSVKNSKNAVQALLKNGVDPNLTITESSPPFVIAAKKKSYGVMKILLDGYRDKLDLNKGDKKGKTALHVVVKDRNLEMVVMLLNAGARMDIKDNLGKEPISTEAMKDLMDMSLQADDEKFTYDDEYRIKLCFALFIHRQTIRPQPSIAPASAQSPKSWQEDVELGLLNDSAKGGNSTNNEYCGAGDQTEVARLCYITESYPEDSILKHPLVKSFLLLKWPKLQGYFYFNLACVTLFTLFVNIFIILRCNKNGECSDITSTCLIVVISVLWSAMVIREFIQLFTSFHKYIHNIENILDLALIFFAVLIVFVDWDNEDVRLTFAVVTVLLSWLQLFLVSGRHPLLSEYMQILKTVTKNFLLVLSWYSTILVSFATCFFLLLRTHNESFSNFGLTFFHVFTMMVGELNSDSVAFNAVPFLSYSLFVAFIFLVTIVLFNLLNGLAISDIQEIKETASLLSIRSRVRLMKDIEHSLMKIYKRRIPFVSRILSLDRIMIFTAETSVYVYPNSNCYVVIGAPEHKLSMDRSVLSETMKVIGDKSVIVSEGSK